MLLGKFPNLDRLRSVGLPAGTGEEPNTDGANAPNPMMTTSHAVTTHLKLPTMRAPKRANGWCSLAASCLQVSSVRTSVRLTPCPYWSGRWRNPSMVPQGVC